MQWCGFEIVFVYEGDSEEKENIKFVGLMKGIFGIRILLNLKDGAIFWFVFR